MKAEVTKKFKSVVIIPETPYDHFRLGIMSRDISHTMNFDTEVKKVLSLEVKIDDLVNSFNKAFRLESS